MPLSLFVDESTSSPEVFPVRTCPVPGKVPESKPGSDPVSGEKCSGSSQSADRDGYWLRTSLLSALEGLTGFCLTWKKQATPAGRSWWVLGRSGLRTSEIECGSWLTPKASDGRDKGVGGKDQSKSVLFQVRDWPTPTKTDETGRGYQMSRGKPLPSLPGTVGAASMPEILRWPSPQANDQKNLGEANPGHSPQLRHLPGPLGADKSNMTGRRHGSLNGPWVLQLMGYPADWCMLPEDTLRSLRGGITKRHSGRQVIASSHRSSK
jgi:hypothetical protein